MEWYIIVLLCILSCWVGVFLMALLSISKCSDCKSKEFNNTILKCKKCGMEDLHITEYEIHNNIKKE